MSSAGRGQMLVVDASCLCEVVIGGPSAETIRNRLRADSDQAAPHIIDVIYHFDGHTYGAVPNAGESRPGCLSSFGIDALRQFLIVQK